MMSEVLGWLGLPQSRSTFDRNQINACFRFWISSRPAFYPGVKMDERPIPELIFL